MPQSPPRRSTPAASASKWHAVSVQPGEPPCDAVLRMRSVRFLAAEAPRIPVPYCAWPARCQCVYRHHADRRVGLRRIAAVALALVAGVSRADGDPAVEFKGIALGIC